MCVCCRLTWFWSFDVISFVQCLLFNYIFYNIQYDRKSKCMCVRVLYDMRCALCNTDYRFKSLSIPLNWKNAISTCCQYMAGYLFITHIKFIWMGLKYTDTHKCKSISDKWPFYFTLIYVHKNFILLVKSYERSGSNWISFSWMNHVINFYEVHITHRR